MQHNLAVIITGIDDTLERALAAGFVVIGEWQGPYGGMGPLPTKYIALRKTVPTYLAGVVNYYEGERAPEEWFS